MTVSTIACSGLLAPTVLSFDHGLGSVSILDVLAIARLDGAAEILLVEFADGTREAFTIRQLLAADGLHLDLTAGSARLRGRPESSPSGSDHVVAIEASSFASFVGVA